MLSATSLLGTCAVPAFAGDLTKEELIQKYAPYGAYTESDINISPSSFPAVMSDGTIELERYYLIKLQIEQLSLEEQAQAVRDKFYSFPEGTVWAYNDYRRGNYEKCLQWFVDAEYENGFWYILQEDGTASIVGADQEWVAENSPDALYIPPEIGGAAVTKIENNAFAYQTQFNPDIKEIVIPDTVEIIGNGAFNSAMPGSDCKMNLPKHVRYIGRMAFYGTMHTHMNEFNVITIPESTEFIGKYAFDDNRAKDRTHLSFYNGVVDYILDMPESPVFCEVPEILIYEYGDDSTTYKEKTAEIVTVGNYNLERNEKCEQFLATYDTDKMPLNGFAYMTGIQRPTSSAMFLNNQYNVVTLDDVAEYYSKRAAKPAASARLAGDADCSGTVDVSDAVLTARFVAEDAGAKITDAGLQNADADGDGAVTMDDITAIQRIIAKL